MAFVTDSNHPQLLWQPAPTAHLTASGTAFEVPPFCPVYTLFSVARNKLFKNIHSNKRPLQKCVVRA